MSSSREDRGPRNRIAINMNEGYEVRYWSNELRITLEQLRFIVSKVGPLVQDVRLELTRGAAAWRP